ncbi:hypothetical protein Dimus_001763 [Dionaea muscipula]
MAAVVPEEDKGGVVVDSSTAAATEVSETKAREVTKKKERGVVSRVLHRLFRSRTDDFERRLERISKEETSVMSRLRRRSLCSQLMKRRLIIFSVLLEIVAVGYAIVMARSLLDWKKRAFHILPMFILPALSSVTYSALVSYVNMCNTKDQKTLEKLRAERQSKIDELKVKTNYYNMQQLIQKYDTDPAAKAAAATVLASKLGADSGLKVYVTDESNINVSAGKSNDVELVPSGGLRNRKQPLGRSNSTGSTVLDHSEEAVSQHLEAQSQAVFVDHYQGQGSTAYAGGWLARIAALLVGEDPTQCYALICGNCHMHNGLASKEDFPYVTYICPHCHAVNGPRYRGEDASGTDTLSTIQSSTTADHGPVSKPDLPSSTTLNDDHANLSLKSSTTVDDGNVDSPTIRSTPSVTTENVVDARDG